MPRPNFPLSFPSGMNVENILEKFSVQVSRTLNVVVAYRYDDPTLNFVLFSTCDINRIKEQLEKLITEVSSEQSVKLIITKRDEKTKKTLRLIVSVKSYRYVDEKVIADAIFDRIRRFIDERLRNVMYIRYGVVAVRDSSGFVNVHVVENVDPLVVKVLERHAVAKNGSVYKVDESVANVVYLLLGEINDARLSLTFNDFYIMPFGVIYKVSEQSAKTVTEDYLRYLENRYGVYIVYDPTSRTALVYRACRIERRGDLLYIYPIGGSISEQLVDTFRKIFCFGK